MVKKIYILSALLSTYANCTMLAQSQVVTDSNGRTMEIYIPIVEEDPLSVEFTDEKFYQQQGFHSYFRANERETETETDAISRRIKRLPSSIPMTYNEEVRRHIDRYVKSGRRSTCYLLSRAKYYNHFFEEALRFYGLPLELKYLPVIESGLNPNATSRVGAVGLWQFMSTTGKQYDLCINSYVDERRDPIKSSYAAARMLSDLYRSFGDWTLALAAYNCGPTRVRNAIDKAGGSVDFWKIYEFLPKETRGYVPAFIAANYVMTYFGDYNLYPETTGLPQIPGKVQITQDVSFTKIANIMEMSIEDLKTLNPQYKQGIVKTNNGVATLVLPAEEVDRFNSVAPLLYQELQTTVGTQTSMAANVNETHTGSGGDKGIKTAY